MRPSSPDVAQRNIPLRLTFLDWQCLQLHVCYINDAKAGLLDEFPELTLRAMRVEASFTVILETHVQPALDQRLLLLLITKLPTQEMRLPLPSRSRTQVRSQRVFRRDEHQIDLLPLAGGLAPAKPDPPRPVYIAIPQAGLNLPAVDFPGERACDRIAGIAVAVPLNRLAHELAVAAGVAVRTQLVQPRKVLPAVAGLEPELGHVLLLGLIALWIPRNGRGGIADDELVDRQVELFTAGAELILR